MLGAGPLGAPRSRPIDGEMRLPALSLDHLLALTDGPGIVQFAKLGVGDPHSGYAIDDNARALIVAAKLPPGRRRERLAEVYLSLLLHAQRPDGTLAHEVGYDRALAQVAASDDGLGRCVWACAEVVASDLPEAMKRTATRVLRRARPHLAGIRHVRGWANAVQGLALYAHLTGDGDAREAAVQCADHLLAHLASHSDSTWVWFEDILTYEPGRLPLGLLFAAALTGETRYLEAAGRALTFLERTLYEVTSRGRIFIPIGNRGWYPRGGERARYDQQPVDAGSMVEAWNAAEALMGDRKYRSLARDTFGWFLGANSAGTPVYDPVTGACHDGLHPGGANLNAGGESTICYLLARLTISATMVSISRLPGAPARTPGLRGSRRAERDLAMPGRIAPPDRPTASPPPATPSPRR